MASSVMISTIFSSLQTWEVNRDAKPEFVHELRLMKVKLRNLMAFVVSAKTLGKDAHLESLLLRIEISVARYSKEIQRVCGGEPDVLLKWFLIIVDEIIRFEEELHARYSDMFPDHKNQSSSSSLTAKEIVGIIDSVLENLVDFPLIFRDQNSHLLPLVNAMDALRTQMKFLKNFLQFVVVFEPTPDPENLLSHFEAVAINAARLFIGIPVDEFDEKWSLEMQNKCLVLLQQIKPVDPQVCQIYTEALSSFKSSTLLLQTDAQVCQDFLDSLISDLWDLLRLDAGYLDSKKNQWQVLYEGLRYLRTILKRKPQQPEKVDGKVRDQIGTLVRDAGVLIFSFHHSQPDETNHGLEDLVKRILVIQSEETEENDAAEVEFSTTNVVEFVDSLLGDLKELTSCNGDPTSKSHVQTIQDELNSLRSSFKEAEGFLPLQNRVLDVAYRVEFLLDQLAVGDIPDSLSLLSDSIVKDLVNIKADLLQISCTSPQSPSSATNEAVISSQDHTQLESTTDQSRQWTSSNTSNAENLHGQSEITSSSQSPQKPSSTTNDAVDLHGQAESIMNQLKSGTKNLKAVAIWGMPGVGKTTLASKIYNDQRIMKHFAVRAWCPVSEQFDKRKVLIEILNQINEMTAQKLAEKRKELFNILEQIDPKRFSELTEEDFADKGKMLKEFLDQMNKMPVEASTRKREVFCNLLKEIDEGKYLKMGNEALADNRKVLSELFALIYPERYSEMDEKALEEKVARCLKRKKYLIYLDDVWSTKDWDSLSLSFPDDSTESRIMVTSRPSNIVPRPMLESEPHLLNPLTTDQGFKLLQSKLFPGEDWPPILSEFGWQFAEYCKGIPLTIVTVAGLLAKVERQSWNNILEDLVSGASSGAETYETFMNAMELSYRHLPHHLKPCLLYFGAFTEDQEVSVRRLVQLWKAEGFILISGQKRITDVSGEYVKELIERSLVMIAKKGSAGGARSCRIHDLVREFCLRKAEKESFFHLLNGVHDQLSDFNEPRYLRRLCIYYEGKGFKDSKLFCPRARSLMLFSSQKKPGYEQYWLATSFIIPIFKLLKVLDLEQIHLGDEFPSEIEILLQLRYLSVRGGMEAIPASVGKLSNLETLIVYLERVHLNVSFPRTLWNLKKLKWLFINSGGGILPVENLEDSPVLQELESLSCAVIYSHAIMEKQLRKFPNIRRLKCDLSRLFAQNQNLNEIVVPGFLEKLESLHLLLSDLTLMKQKRHATFDFSLPANLKKLTLSRFGLPWEKISAIGKELNQLEVLKLLDSCFVGDTWEMQYDEFQNLRYLKLARLDLVNWTADASFEYLEKLVLESCSNLVDIPSCLGSVTKLETIDVISCSDSLESVVQEIEREQKEDWGNKSFRVRSR